MRHIIYGAGAVGSVIGGCLTEAGMETVLIGRAAHVEAMRSNGLRIERSEGERLIRVKAVVHPSELEFQEGDIIFLTLKSQDTPEAAETLRHCRALEVPIFCFQNGVENEQFLTENGFSRVYGGLVYFGATFVRPGVVINSTVNGLGIGHYPEGLDDTIRLEGTVLERAGFVVKLYERIMEGKATKLLTNLNNALLAACDRSFQEVLGNKETRAFSGSVLEEGLRVLRASNVALEDLPDGQSPESLVHVWNNLKDHSLEQGQHLKDGDVRPSTWQDFYLGRGKSEVPFLNGQIVKLGRQVGIPTPYNECLCRIIERMETDGLGVGSYTLEQIEEELERIVSPGINFDGVAKSLLFTTKDTKRTKGYKNI